MKRKIIHIFLFGLFLILGAGLCGCVPPPAGTCTGTVSLSPAFFRDKKQLQTLISARGKDSFLMILAYSSKKLWDANKFLDPVYVFENKQDFKLEGSVKEKKTLKDIKVDFELNLPQGKWELVAWLFTNSRYDGERPERIGGAEFYSSKAIGCNLLDFESGDGLVINMDKKGPLK